MQFISILIVLGLLQYLGSVQFVHRDEWFVFWKNHIVQQFGNSTASYVLTVGLPCLLLLLLLLSTGNWAWGAVELLISVLVLMYSLGRGEYGPHLDDYISAWNDGDYEKLRVCIQALDSGYKPGLGEGIQSTHVAARESFIYCGFTRLFAVLFWFVLLGPVGALLYRLTQLYINQSSQEFALKVKDIMEWPAARLLGLTFAVVGDFSAAMANWMTTLMNSSMSNKQVVHANALAALDLDMQWLDGKFGETHSLQMQAKMAINEINAIRQLINRSLIFSVIVIAVYQILI